MTWRCDSAAVSRWEDKIMCCWWRPEFAVQQSYREKKAKPLMEKIVKVLRSVYASYLDVSRKFDKLQLSYNRVVEKADNLSNRIHEIYTENQELKEVVRDYECVKAVLGKEKVSGIVQMEKQREQLLKEQKRTERRKQNREAR